MFFWIVKRNISNAFFYSGEAVDEVYEGEFSQDGKRQGVGVLTYADGGVYRGQFEAGKLHGVGTFLYDSGDVYDGEWVDDHMDGLGTYFDSKGNVYRGQWREDMQEGYGIYWGAECGTAKLGFYHQDVEVGEGVE